MMSAAFHPIAMLGPLMLHDGIVGMTEASATRKPVTPRTLKRVSTTVFASLAIRQVPQL